MFLNDSRSSNELARPPTEERSATQTVITERKQDRAATLEAIGSKVVSDATVSAQQRSTLPPAAPLLVEDLPGGLLNDLDTIPWRIDALTPIMERCAAEDELENVEYYAKYFTVGGNVMLDISEDTRDGVMDHYDADYIHSFVQDTHSTLDDIERQCSR